MRKLLLSMLAAVSAVAMPAAANAVVVGGANINLANGPFTFGPSTANSFTFTYSPGGSFNLDPLSISTTGNAAVTAFGGFLGIPLAPSTFFTRANASIGPNTIPGFASFPNPAVIRGSLVASDIGLRYTVGSDNFFGYARFAGPNLISFGFETQANTAITAGSFVAAAVPEPAAWAMMISGFGIVGGALRRRTTRLAIA